MLDAACPPSAALQAVAGGDTRYLIRIHMFWDVPLMHEFSFQLSGIENPESSICSPQARGYLFHKFIWLKRRSAKKFSTILLQYDNVEVNILTFRHGTAFLQRPSKLRDDTY